MNIDEIREAQVRFDNKIEGIKKEYKKLYIIRSSFVKYFNPKRILTMSLEDYVIGLGKPETGHYNFCYGIERDLSRLGSIRGATAFKFGVYHGRTKPDSVHKYRFTKKFGSTLKEAFSVVKQSISELLEAGKRKDLNAIKENKLSTMFKGKILCTYYPEIYLNVFAKPDLDYLLKKLELDTKELMRSSTIYKREALIKFKNSDPIMKNWSIDLFSDFLYEEYPGRPPKKGTNTKPKDPLRDYRSPNFPANQTPEFITLNILPRKLGKMTIPKKGLSNRGNPNYEKEARKLKKLGDRGERIVIDLEKKTLTENNRKDLANKVERVSISSDSYGFDIISFDTKGEEKLIEVKATSSKVGSANFFLTANELKTAKKNKNYYIYMVYDILSKSPKVWVMQNPFNPENKNIIKTPINYRITISAK